jgi:hypothetical protein
MQSYRKRISVQMQPVKQKPKDKPIIPTTKNKYQDVRAFLLKAIWMHEEVSWI